MVGDYFVFRTYECQTSCICKRTEKGMELIAKGSQTDNFTYAIATDKTKKSPYIFFIENNVNSADDTIKEKECPLYAIQVASGIIKAVNFPVPIKNPYFVNLIALSNGDLLATYCDDGKYDPVNKKQFLLLIGNLCSFFEKQ